MNPAWRTRIIVALVLAVLAAAIYFPILKRRVKRQAQVQQKSEEQARRELVQSLNASTKDEPKVKARLFWASDTDASELAPTTIELPLSDDPILRAKQVLNTLLAGPVDSELRTLPPDAALLAFYILPDGTAVADFSEAMATAIPSGVQSEQLAVDSITKTLEANVPRIRRLKILIHGQEAETLAGHLDLTQTFPVSSPTAPATSNQPSVAAPSPVSK